MGEADQQVLVLHGRAFQAIFQRSSLRRSCIGTAHNFLQTSVGKGKVEWLAGELKSWYVDLTKKTPLESGSKSAYRQDCLMEHCSSRSNLRLLHEQVSNKTNIPNMGRGDK